MELAGEAGKVSSDHSREEHLVEEEEDLLSETRHNKEISKQYYPFSSSSNSSPPNLWLGMLHHHQQQQQSPDAATCTTPSESHNSSSGGLGLHHKDAAPDSNPKNRLDFMDLSLGSTNKEEEEEEEEGNNRSSKVVIEKEHMFDKVVTPSDVGKLNRLVIPKQHAERYFPLDSSSNEKGLLLNFEDRNGKLWRFRYSYWNSSQSYVMTKGWSRFVKEKKLDAGDIVSFQRGLGDLFRHRLYIDWRRRPDYAAAASAADHHLHFHHHHHRHHAAGITSPLLLPNQYSIRWDGRLYSVPTVAAPVISPPLPPPPLPSSRHHHHHEQFHQQISYNHYPFQYQRQVHNQHQYNNEMKLGSGSSSLYYLRTPPPPSVGPGDRGLTEHYGGGNVSPMIIDSVPVVHGKSGGGSSTSTGKKLRLFGVNMECCSSTSSSSSNTIGQHVPIVGHHVPIMADSSPEEEEEDHQKGKTSVFFDLSPSSSSFPYHHHQ